MSTSSTLDILIGLAQEALDAAGRTLAGHRRNQQQAQTQLDTLVHYQREYRRGLQQAMQDGIAPASLHNYRAFLASLDSAIERASQTVAIQCQQVDNSQRNWQEQRRKLNSYDTLVERRAVLAQVRENRAEQRLSDEFSAQMRLRSAGFPTSPESSS
ncbi:flagellar export protein FliJ [Azotobacter bryophylli]|uniref:Flagellar FliJ protein n=1 Tax=Azotobacter bryophylli TaxID=1986537 RepID=A0ABV7AT70_9GAMM